MCHVITLEWKNHLLPFHFFCITQLENNLTSFTLTMFEKDKTYCFFLVYARIIRFRIVTMD